MMRLLASLAALAVISIGLVFMFQPKAQTADSQDVFAADRDAGFDANKAMDYLKEICKFGPRLSGSAAMKKQQDLLKKHFEKCGGKVTLQRFTGTQPSQKKPFPLVNMIVSWNPDRDHRLMVCTHYDTRPIADQEPDKSRWRGGFLGANDGASGVALLMELGNLMKDGRVKAGVDFVFFDGEEYIFNPGTDKFFLGSEHFAHEYTVHPPRKRYRAAILLDMVGGKDASFPIEPNSWQAAGRLVQDVWGIAAKEKCTAFDGRHFGDGAIEDDHLCLNRARIPTVDIIDYNYFKTHWHRLSDLPENCSTDTLSQVARVVLAWLKQG
jgi:glutaminyl-peptide cyclotransferase